MTETSLKNSRLFVFNSLACHGWHKGSIFTLAFSTELKEIPWNKFAECSGEPQPWSVLHLTSLSQRCLFLLKLLTFIGKLSFWGVRWCVIVSTADFANDTPLLVRHVNWTHPEISMALWLAANQIHRGRWPRPVWNARPVNPQSTSHLFRLSDRRRGYKMFLHCRVQNTL